MVRIICRYRTMNMLWCGECSSSTNVEIKTNRTRHKMCIHVNRIRDQSVHSNTRTHTIRHIAKAWMDGKRNFSSCSLCFFFCIYISLFYFTFRSFHWNTIISLVCVYLFSFLFSVHSSTECILFFFFILFIMIFRLFIAFPFICFSLKSFNNNFSTIPFVCMCSSCCLVFCEKKEIKRIEWNCEIWNRCYIFD